MREKKRKTGIMGGTFDPIHIGHLILGESAYDQFGLDRILFMPAGNPPHKRDRRGRASDEERVERRGTATRTVRWRSCARSARMMNFTLFWEQTLSLTLRAGESRRESVMPVRLLWQQEIRQADSSLTARSEGLRKSFKGNFSAWIIRIWRSLPPRSATGFGKERVSVII